MRYVVRHILAVQNQSLSLGQIARNTQTQFVNRDSSKVHVNTEWFYEHYCSDRHNGIEDWVIMLIGSADTLKQLRSKELCRMHKVKTHVLTKGMFIKRFENSKQTACFPYIVK